MSNGEPRPNAFPSYPELSRQIESLAHAWSTSSLDPADWADQAWASIIPDPGERRRARVALRAATRHDLAVEIAAINIFLLGVWLGQLGRAKLPDVHEGRRRGGRGRS